jgi:hypothetical protein
MNQIGNDRITDLVKALPKNRSFSFREKGDIYCEEKPFGPKSGGWWIYKAHLGHELSSKCDMNNLSELICLLLNRELEK